MGFLFGSLMIGGVLTILAIFLVTLLIAGVVLCSVGVIFLVLHLTRKNKQRQVFKIISISSFTIGIILIAALSLIVYFASA